MHGSIQRGGGNRVAALPWYDLPPTRGALDGIWRGMRRVLEAARVEGLPRELARGDHWRSPDLLVSQCCGLDLHAPRMEHLEPFAVPVFGGLECDPGSYFSVIVGTPREGARLAVNALHSRSGHSALRAWLMEQGIRASSVTFTGSHAASLDCVRAGGADLAAIDAFTWRFLRRAGVRVLGRSSHAPAPPFVHRRGVDPELLFESLERGIAAAGHGIGMTGVRRVDRVSYEPVRREAIELGILPRPARSSPRASGRLAA